MKSLLFIALLLGLVAGARAQTADQPTDVNSTDVNSINVKLSDDKLSDDKLSDDKLSDVKPTLQERMRHSISKQLDAASRMQGSVERQKLASEHQTGQPAEAGFFALPKPASLGPPVYRPVAVPIVVDQKPAEETEQKHEKDYKEDKEDKEDKDEIPPPGLIPFDPALLEPLKPILPIPGIESPVKVFKGTKGTASTTPKMEELLRGLGAQGFQGFLRGQFETNPAYSGRDNAPLTSFSLMDWLFGL